MIFFCKKKKESENPSVIPYLPSVVLSVWMEKSSEVEEERRKDGILRFPRIFFRY